MYGKLKDISTDLNYDEDINKIIIEIRGKYGLSQSELAKKIMIGAKNIARYETGKIQDKSIDLLIRILNDHPELFGIKIKSKKDCNKK